MPEPSSSLEDWRQGDFCLAVKRLPILAGEDIAGESVEGIVLISQTCDVVRDPALRPFVQVAGLVKVEPVDMTPIKLFREPRLAFLPALADQCLVADLDVVATVEKEMLTQCARSSGCFTPDERRDLAYALGRHKHRVAFPDGWVHGLDDLRTWVKKKGKKPGGADGKFINAVEQIRISAEHVEQPERVELIVILNDGWTDDDRRTWSEQMCPKIEALVDKAWCGDVTVRLMDAAEITMAEYFESTRLDYGALTER